MTVSRSVHSSFRTVLVILLLATLTLGAFCQRIASLTVDPLAVDGGLASVGTVTLSKLAPRGGFRASIRSDNACAIVPASILIPFRSRIGRFDISTTPVSSDTTVTLTASAGECGPVQAALVVKAPALVGQMQSCWSRSGGSASSTYCGAGNLPNSHVAFTFSAPGNAFSQVVHDNLGHHYFGSEGGGFFCLNDTGGLVWSFPDVRCASSSPSLASDGSICFGTDDGFGYSLNPDGTLRWSVNVGGRVYPSPVISKGVVCFANINSGNGVFAYDALTGQQLWSKPGMGEIYDLYLAPDGNPIVPAGNGGDGLLLRKLDVLTGATMWQSSVPASYWSILRDGSMIGVRDNNGSSDLIVVDTGSGLVIRTTSFLTAGSQTLAVNYSQSTVYVAGGQDGLVRAFSSSDLSLQWTSSSGYSGTPLGIGLVVGADDTVYESSGEGGWPGVNSRVTTFRGSDGTVLSRTPVPYLSVMSMDRLGRLYVGSNGTLTVLGR